MARQVIGIDFGTTFSSISLMAIGSTNRPEWVHFTGARLHVPTLLTLDKNDKSVINWGWDAQGSNRLRLKDPNLDVARYFKRKLGKDKEAKKLCSLFLKEIFNKICQEKNLEKLKEDDFITSVGVPANWEENQREELKSTLEEIGFPDIRLLEEPVAAMHNLRVQAQEKFKFGDRQEDYMVIDFGGGTLDICIVRTQELGRSPEINATDGDANLGGIDFDNIIQTAFLRQVNIIDIDKLSIFDKNELNRQIQEAKESFSEAFLGNNDSAHTTIHLSTGDYSFALAKDNFYNLCRDQGIINKIERASKRILATAKLKPTDIRMVILTGGSSKWYFVKEIVSKLMGVAGEKLFYTHTPYTDVASGLAINIGRADEPPEKPGEWIRYRINSGPWSNYKVVFSPGRVHKEEKQCRLYLDDLKGSCLLKSHSIELEWAQGLKSPDENKTKLSIIKLLARNNHPMLKRLSNTIDAARGKNTTHEKDVYPVFLLYQEDEFDSPKYELAIQNSKNSSVKLPITPGKDLRNRWLGLGKPCHFDHIEPNTGVKKRSLASKVKSIFNNTISSVKGKNK